MAKEKNNKYLAHVRAQPCLVCKGFSDAHHVRFDQKPGMGQTVGDNWTVPLCRRCHMELHAFGDEETWWHLKGIDPLAWAEQSWRAYNAKA